MKLIDKRLAQYAEAHTSPESEALARINRETHAKVPLPQMLAGHLQGQFLRMMSLMMRPRRVLEIGTYTGYSAICFTAGLRPGGKVHTIESNTRRRKLIERNLKLAGVEKKIVCHFGRALDVIPRLKGPFDLAYIDADKGNYSRYFDLAIERVPSGGYILADNTLWYGQVLAAAPDADTRAIIEFNAKVQVDPRVENILLPVRDLCICHKS